MALNRSFWWRSARAVAFASAAPAAEADPAAEDLAARRRTLGAEDPTEGLAARRCLCAASVLLEYSEGNALALAAAALGTSFGAAAEAVLSFCDAVILHRHLRFL